MSASTSTHTPSNAPATLWCAYRANPSPENRNALMLHYLPLVRFAAARMAAKRRPPAGAEFDDFLQWGTFGLKDAIASFDPARGVKFETYSATRIRGAMLDGLKSQQWMPRDLRQQVTRFAENRQSLETQYGARPANDLLAGRLGVCEEAVFTLEQHAARANIMSLHAAPQEDEQGMDLHHTDHLSDHREEQPQEVQQRNDIKDMLLHELTRPQRLLIIMYYYEQLTMREIGAALGISGTRVSQMHSEILARLRTRFDLRVRNEDGALQNASNL